MGARNLKIYFMLVRGIGLKGPYSLILKVAYHDFRGSGGVLLR